MPVAIYMDLSKAFDTLDHKILITKLQHYGIRGTSLKWLINYLSDRTQFVAVNDVCSSSKVIQMGVTQGSILGPLLFLIYMNDIPNSNRHLDYILYADDTTLFNTIGFSAPNEDSGPSKTINDELHEVSNWLVANRLSLISRKLSIWFSLLTKKYRLPNIKYYIKWECAREGRYVQFPRCHTR